MVEWISKKKKLFIILGAVLQILYPLVLAYKHCELEDIYYIVQIVTAIFVCISGSVAVWQYFFSTRSARIQQQAEQIQKSIDLSEYYKDNILPLYRNVKYVYQKAGICALLETSNTKLFNNFDCAERDLIYEKGIAQKLKEKMRSSDCIDAVVEAIMINGKISDIGVEDKFHIDTCLCDIFIENQIVSLLNNLEYFAMHFTHNTADDSVIYASLHQTYLNMVEMLYCNIAAYNSPDKPSFYTNTTELYKKWKEKRNSDDAKIVDEARKSTTHKGNSVDKY